MKTNLQPVGTVCNDKGIPFNIEVDTSKQTHQHAIDEPRVIIKDARFINDTMWLTGQPVSSYYLSTFLEACPEGLCLHGGARDQWYLDQQALEKAQGMVSNFLGDA